MSAWNDMKAGFRQITNTVIRKTDELASEAALAVKRKTTEAHLANAYEKLGRISYKLLAKGDSIREDESFIAAACEVTRLRKELAILEKEEKSEGAAKTENADEESASEASASTEA